MLAHDRLAHDRLALGTAQFGLVYGVANQTGRVPPDEVAAILRHAAAHGIDMLDTAVNYADSERTLGEAGVTGWRAVTKLPALPAGITGAAVAPWVRQQVDGSLARLGLKRLHAVLLHRPAEMRGSSAKPLLDALLSLKTRGLARKIGASVYGPDDLDLLQHEMPLDLVQAPLNILDRRLVDSGWAARLKRHGAELHVRSAFLQGLLLMPAERRPARFARWQPLWAEWARWLGETGLTPLEACLGYVLGVPEVDRVVVGVDNLRHLEQILAAARPGLPQSPPWSEPADIELINPTFWSEP
ncbi:MAG: Putative oxidoreductase [Burkholderiaceae bacterium]|jgi:aryl-alcohol dehydrogenase-like predicted oxidoreductase|nr:MAG: Putative oxidoreductase [Burkholderiaceae bacterium]